MNTSEHHQRSATIMGLCAVFFWSTSVAFVRSLSENLGPLTTASLNYSISGILSIAFLMTRRGSLKAMLSLPCLYLFGCGGLFVLYTVCYYMAVGSAVNAGQVIEVGLINYLWPSLTLLLSVPLQGKKANIWLIPGTLIAFGGVLLAVIPAGTFSWNSLGDNIAENRMPYALALIAAFSWALYSNLAGRWGGKGQGNGVPLFFLASGIIIGSLRLLHPEQAMWNGRVVLEFLLMMLLTTLLAYQFWDIAMRKGNMVLVAAASYSAPLISTIITGLYLGVTPGLRILSAAGLVIAGAVICKVSLKEQKSNALPESDDLQPDVTIQ